MKFLDNNAFMDECREAYKKSLAYRLLQEGKPIGTAGEVVRETLPERVKPKREPGQDDEPALGIALDDLEREFADRMEP